MGRGQITHGRMPKPTRLKVPEGNSGKRPIDSDSAQPEIAILPGGSLTIRVCMRLERWGGRELVVAPNGSDNWASPKPKQDNTRIKAFARAQP